MGATGVSPARLAVATSSETPNAAHRRQIKALDIFGLPTERKNRLPDGTGQAYRRILPILPVPQYSLPARICTGPISQSALLKLSSRKAGDIRRLHVAPKDAASAG